uniref:Uncharacterized protein n=1 Tax=Romanomermis culicivorax TaxID=13658 RepID=A0A915I5A3_ROMCU
WQLSKQVYHATIEASNGAKFCVAAAANDVGCCGAAMIAAADGKDEINKESEDDDTKKRMKEKWEDIEKKQFKNYKSLKD